VTTGAASIMVHGLLPRAERDAVLALCAEATEADGVRPLSEHVLLHLRHGGEGPDRNLLLWSSGPDGPVLAGYAHLDPTDVVAGPAAELVVHPAHRRRGLGRMLVEAVAAQADGGRLRLWAHGDHPGARALAEALDFREVRRLWQMRRSLSARLPPADFPAGVGVRAFRPGTDDAAWLDLNARAFAEHPEQGAWTAADLNTRMNEGWFDADGFLIAEQQGRDGQARMLGFHWTKVHGGTDHAHAHDPIGEVYVIGVDPREQGRGLGRALTLAGLHRMRALGLTQAMLYVEADNAAARAVYESLGFAHWDTDVMFSHRAAHV
jgi:mycothiol synthase